MLIRKAISEGATVNTLDNKAMSALRHLINNIRPEAWKSDTMSWTDKMNSIAVLLLSGANVLQGDSCLCACSISGCTATSYLFHTCKSMLNYGITLSTISWLLEWYILLKYLKPPQILKQALNSLFRYQKFEELGMTHTCCIEPSMLSYLLDEHFHHPSEDGRYNTGYCKETAEMDEDIHEILDEEEEFRAMLDTACKDFEEPPGTSDEDKWIEILARRAAFIEEANKSIIDKKSIQSDFITRRPHLEELKVCCFRSIQPFTL
jgi:hypothetical protein